MDLTSLRIGQGVDFHRLAEGEEFWLGGIQIPFEKGAVGHSDADVLLHAICDALFGALSLGDIGTHFPDTDMAYKGIDSKILLKETFAIIKKEGFGIVNMDATICLQQPKLKPHIPAMKSCIAALLQLNLNQVSIKATTTEQMGYVGSGEGIEAHAIVLLAKI